MTEVDERELASTGYPPPLASSKVNRVERERQKSSSVTQAAGDMLADVLPCIKDKFLNFGGAGLLQSGAGNTCNHKCPRLLLK